MTPLLPALEIRLMMRPRALYSAFESGTAGLLEPILRRPIRFAVLLGSTVSFTTTGRLSLRMLVDGVICWAFVPLMHLALVAVLARSLSRRPPGLSVNAFAATAGPWMLWLLALCGLAVWMPPEGTEVWTMAPPPLALVGLAAAWGWSSWIQYRCLTIVWCLPPTRTIAALAAMNIVVWGTIVLFFLATDQLEPRVWFLHGE